MKSRTETAVGHSVSVGQDLNQGSNDLRRITKIRSQSKRSGESPINLVVSLINDANYYNGLEHPSFYSEYSLNTFGLDID